MKKIGEKHILKDKGSVFLRSLYTCTLEYLDTTPREFLFLIWQHGKLFAFYALIVLIPAMEPMT